MGQPPFVTERHLRVRNTLRVAGPIVLLIGLVLAIISAASMFIDSGSFTPDHYFWFGFVGLPLMFVGGVMSMHGFMGAMASYVMQESAPVTKDTFNYLADGTQEGITKTARSVAMGIRQGMAAPTANTCSHCSTANDSDARFCKSCGASLIK